jgi:UDP-N-acetylenolpyruvoylglucosamine reductase
MRISDMPVAKRLAELAVELRPGVSLAEHTSLGIGGTTDLLRIQRYDALPELMRLLASEGVPHRFLGGGTNVLVADGELPWLVLQLPAAHPAVKIKATAPGSRPRQTWAAW